MEKASDLCTFEVCDATGIRDAEKNGKCYRYDIDGIDHPDAILIAAAPDLLEALQSVMKWIDASEHWWIDCPNKGGFDVESIKAAIRKATHQD